MSAQSTLENTLKEILDVVKPTPEDWETRFRIINELRGVVQSIESFRGATVEPFGSFVSNLFSRWGDLDLSIEFSNGSCISSCGKKQKQRLLRDVMRTMRQKGGWSRFHFIPQARVPILKVESNLQNISCDISVDNLTGQMKSKLLFMIIEIDTRFRDMVLLVKEWAKAHNINNAKSGSFNSYSLSLLVVFHFQTCAPAILPPLKDIYPGNLTDDLKGSRADAERLILETCAANMRRFKANKLRPQNISSLSELFISFLGKFSGIDVRASELGICTYNGKWEAIKSNMRWLPQTYAIFIEDPFEQPENTARGVSKNELTRISEAFEMSCRRLISASHCSPAISAYQDPLLATLVQPQTLRFIVRPPFGNLVHNSERRQATQTQWYRAEGSHSQTPANNNGPRQSTRPLVHSPLQAQPQFQKNPYSHFNRSTTKKPPSQTYQDQQQQKWRPKSDRQI